MAPKSKSTSPVKAKSAVAAKPAKVEVVDKIPPTAVQVFDPARAVVRLVEAAPEVAIKAMARRHAKIVACDPDDPASVRAVHDARMEWKNLRTGVENVRKELVESANTYTRAVNSEATRIKDLILPHEDRLQALEDAANAEIRRRKEVEAAKARERLNARVAGLNSVRATFDLAEVEAMSDSQFAACLEEATVAFRKAEAAQAALKKAAGKKGEAAAQMAADAQTAVPVKVDPNPTTIHERVTAKAHALPTTPVDPKDAKALVAIAKRHREAMLDEVRARGLSPLYRNRVAETLNLYIDTLEGDLQ